ncbi:MAG: Rieske (2Fe-2S) protein [Gammaproteobacteria bacterium]|nr:Rieske (2Fe-2S) protein [Gammaproteobacteria bacterium]
MNKEVGSYPQSWYPILRSKELKKNKSRVIKAFDKELLIFRDANEQVGIVGRYCCHMGVDLGNAPVVNNCIQCPLHGWQFDRKGNCLHIPSLKSNDKNILKKRSLNSFPCQEKYGVIWIYWGKKPAYDIPLPPDMDAITVGPCSHFSLTTEFHMPCLNTFDLQHFHHVHHRKIIGIPDISQENLYHMGIKMEVEVIPLTLFDRLMKRLFHGNATISIDCWGASLLLMNNNKTNYGAIIGSLPIEKYKCLMFIIPVKKQSAQQTQMTQIMDNICLKIAEKMVRSFLSMDEIPMRGMKPFSGCLVNELDDAAANYWRYFNSLPRFSVIHSAQKKDE